VRQILTSSVLGAALLAGCGSGVGTPNVPTSAGQTPNVAIVRLFDSTGLDISSHIPLQEGKTDRIRVRLYAADGSLIDFIPGGVQLGFTFAPSSLAQAMPLDTLVWVVTPIAPEGSDGNLSITLKLLATNTTKPFGPFQILVHPPTP
jgi:hypothetical protein